MLGKPVCALLSVSGWPQPDMRPSPDHETRGKKKEVKSLNRESWKRSAPPLSWKGHQGLQNQVPREGKPGS